MSLKVQMESDVEKEDEESDCWKKCNVLWCIVVATVISRRSRRRSGGHKFITVVKLSSAYRLGGTHPSSRHVQKKLVMAQYELQAEVNESQFFNFETRMRISSIQSCTSRQDREFLKLDLRLQDETKKKSPPISGIETRLRFIIFILRLRDKNENSLDLIWVFETRTRILNVDILPWIQAWTASLFCMQFLGGC